MASSSSSHKHSEGRSVIESPGETRKAEESVKSYHVFINHRGPDVKETLALQLYKSLEKLGIRAFLDSEEKEPGVLFQSSIKAAIKSARVHIAIFSKRYAESAWCLEELLLMSETEAKIIPLFYDVKPQELRRIENGCYEEAFKKYKEKPRDTDKPEEWKQSLRKMSYVAGYEISDLNADDECKKIVSAVQKEVQTIELLPVARHLVGLSKFEQELESQCLSDLLQDLKSEFWINEDGQGKARIVGISGMGGTGKTTLSKQLFNKYCLNYTRATFLAEVREVSFQRVLPSLQRKLLKDLFEEDHPTFTSTSEGIMHLQNRMGKTKYVSFLIVLDDIDHSDQLNNLLVTDILKKPGNSLIIITTRDAGVLKRAGIPNYYTLEGLDEDDGRDLFYLHAFDKSSPPSEYESLVEGFVKCCGGIPLSLQILGSDVKGREDQNYWRSALKKARKVLHQDIKKTLKISFDSLDTQEKQIFMDIACFFVGNSKNIAKKIWQGSEWEAYVALETLKEKCLVEEIEKEHLDGLKWEWDGICFKMHDHLRDLGRDMAKELAPPRWWHPQHLRSLELKGFRNILAQTKGRCFHSILDDSMDCRITYFIGEPEDSSDTSLLWLQIDYLNRRQIDANTIIPKWIPSQKLQGLRISNGHLQRLWENDLPAPLQLKELQISETFLEEVPDLGMLCNLESVALDAEYMAIKGWSLLEFLRMNISTLNWNSCTMEGKFASTDAEGDPTLGCFIIQNVQLTEEALDKLPMSGLENLVIGNQSSVTKILFSGNQCASLKTLELYNMENLIEIDLSRVNTLNSILVHSCCSLKRLSGISDLTKLVKLNIFHCPMLQSKLCLPRLHCLERIRVIRRMTW